MIAISIRQPWAWLIVNGYKDVENRTRMCRAHLGKRVLIHAGQTMTVDDYQACVLFINASIEKRGWTLPPWPTLRQECGGIVGSAIIRASSDMDCGSPWWTGGIWWKMEAPEVLPFHPCKGRLGFFNVELPGGFDENTFSLIAPPSGGPSWRYTRSMAPRAAT